MENTERQEIVGASKAESIMIPKHRFDCVNFCLKETKQALADRTAEATAARRRVGELESALLDARVETALLQHGAKNVTAAKALIDYARLEADANGVLGLEAQIESLRKSQSYLFNAEEPVSYLVVPVPIGDPLQKSVKSFMKKNRSAVI